jgi:Na+/H+-translocating membrane pyrophosphatase
MKKAFQNLGSAVQKRLASLLALIVGLTALPAASLAAGGENVQLELTKSDQVYLYVSLVFGFAALVFAALVFSWVKKKSMGTEKMQEVGQAITEGAMAYLQKQISTMAIFVAVIAVGLYFMYSGQYGASLAGWMSVCFIAGVAASYIAGFAGMKMAVMANMRAAAAALTSPKASLEIAFRSGSVAGMVTVGMGLIGASLIFLAFGGEAMKLLVGFGFGGSLAALFMRVGGGIFTKAADVGADLVGKVEAGIPEDDPRNPATIADNVGDNVGDCAGMAADIFESYEVTLVAAIVLGAATAAIFDTQTWTRLILFALMARGVGIVASMIGIFLVKGSDDVNADPPKPIQKGFRGSALIAIAATVGLAYFMMGGNGKNIITTNQLVSAEESLNTPQIAIQKVRSEIAEDKHVNYLMVTEKDLMEHEDVKALDLKDDLERLAAVRAAIAAESDVLSDTKGLKGYSKIALDSENPVLDYAVVDRSTTGSLTPTFQPLKDAFDWNDMRVFTVDVSTSQGGETNSQQAHIGPMTQGEFDKFTEEFAGQAAQSGYETNIKLRAAYKVDLYANAEGSVVTGFSSTAEDLNAPSSSSAESDDTAADSDDTAAGSPSPRPQEEGQEENAEGTDEEQAAPVEEEAAPSPVTAAPAEDLEIHIPKAHEVFGREAVSLQPIGYYKLSVEEMTAIETERANEAEAQQSKQSDVFTLEQEGKSEEAAALREEIEGFHSAVPAPVEHSMGMAKVEHQDVPWWRFLLCIVFGIIMAFAFEALTDYYVGLHRKPVQEVAHISSAGPAPMIITGFAYGKESAVFSVFAIVICLIGPLVIFPAAVFGGYLLSFYGIALVGLGLLTTTGYILAMDTFGPISDNAQGVFEMSGAAEDNPDGARAVQLLDAAGNTTKALTKGFAIATAVVAAVALFHAFVDTSKLTTLGMSLDVPEIFLGLLIGGAAPYLFSAFSINAVGRSAFELINEVRAQFRNDPGIMAGTSKPDYGRCVAIVTAAAQRELLGPGILAIAFPVLVAFGFSIGKPTTVIAGAEYSLVGAQALGGFLAGSIVSGQLMAVMLANSGGLWDNAKKLIEDGLHGGKGTEAHKAAIVCDTVGDPFKDTAGPALNPLIKVMNLVALLLAPAVIMPMADSKLIIITLGAAAALGVAIYWSKRGSMADGMPSEPMDAAPSIEAESSAEPTPAPAPDHSDEMTKE